MCRLQRRLLILTVWAGLEASIQEPAHNVVDDAAVRNALRNAVQRSGTRWLEGSREVERERSREVERGRENVCT